MYYLSLQCTMIGLQPIWYGWKFSFKNDVIKLLVLNWILSQSMICSWKKTNYQAFKKMHLKHNRHSYWLKCQTSFFFYSLWLKIYLIIYHIQSWISTLNISKILRKFSLQIGYEKQTFSNFSCMFLNPNNFFQFQF